MDIKLDEIIAELQAIKDEVAKKYKAEIIGILDYYVHGEGEADEEVYINILARFKKGATLFDLVDLANFLEEKLRMKVNVVSEETLSPEGKKHITYL